MTSAEWVRGDTLGLDIPANKEALSERAEAFLTEAFHKTGALAADNRVAAITQFDEILVGGTGRKLLLSVAYEKPAPELHTELFVKFSRNVEDAIRDAPRHLLASEIRFASLSRMPGFPIAVPVFYFGDNHAETGTGLLITQRIAYGKGGIERHYEKGLDYEMPEPLEHYAAVVKAMARLAGAHKAGRLPASVADEFPFDREKAIEADRTRYTAKQLQNRVARFSDFAAKYPQLVPTNITSPAFIERLSRDVVLYKEHESTFKRTLYSRPEFIALCHWNANIDNAWFWRNAQGERECGLLDWGGVGQMSVAQSFYGSVSGAEPEIWDNHLDDLLAVFIDEFERCGGPALDAREMKIHVHLFTAMMGLAYIIDAPPIIQAELPNLAEMESRYDPRLRANETARVWLHVVTMLMNEWEHQNFGAVFDEVLSR